MSFTFKGPKEQPDRNPKPNVETPKYASDKNSDKPSEKSAFKPEPTPHNKIQPYTPPPNNTTKNKIKPHVPPNYKPKNKIGRPTLPPNYTPKNKIESPTLPPNYTPKNKIEPYRLPPNYKPKNKIPQPEGSEIHQSKKKALTKTENEQIQPQNVNNNPKTHQKLYNDGERKECGRCHETKSFNEFERKSNKTYERYCKPCRLEYKQVRALQNKSKIIRNIYDGKYAEKCPKCNITTAKLPAFDFHHFIKELKTNRINFHGKWENVLKKLEKEKAIPLCRNCHLKEQSKYYKKYKDLIENKNDFESSVKNIEKKLYDLIYKRFPDIGHKEGHQIKSWISKRIVVDRLYNGKCISCGEDNTATLQFHHRDISKKTFQKYDKLRYTTIEKIEKMLIKDDAVCICGNCHRMTEAYYFEKNHQEIIGNKYNRELTFFYKNLKESIRNYKFPANILEQYPHIKNEKIEFGWKPTSYELTHDEERIKKEISSTNWNKISQNWKLSTGEILNPSKESSSTNPLYKHKDWLEYVYYEWGLSDNKIARITNTSQTTIHYWRNKLKIYSINRRK